MENTKILQNAAMCTECKTILVSNRVHDYKVCNCGSITVDGGHEYLRRSSLDELFVRDLSISVPTDGIVSDFKLIKECFNRALWGTFGKDGQSEFKYKFIKDLDDEHVEAILRDCNVSKLTRNAMLYFRLKRDKANKNFIKHYFRSLSLWV